MATIRAIVVEDSLTIRKYLVDALSHDPEIRVVGEALDGQTAIELCETLRPDVVSLDMMLPILSGLAATEHIMAYCPTPILIVSASTNRGEVFKTYDALAAGAVDVLEKPRDDGPPDQWEEKYRQAIRMVSRIKVITHPRARLMRSQPLSFRPGAGSVLDGAAALRREEPPPAGRGGAPPGGFRCVALGTSTGGPNAVVQILKGLPARFPLPILLVIHIGSPFGGALTEWLNTVSSLPVREIEDGQLIPEVGEPGVIVAPPDRHLVVRDGRLWVTMDAERHFCPPSVDVLFESLALELGESSIACLLTGMGRDGAAGLLAIKKAGGMTLAQDEASCVVFGMPREAIRLNAARRIVSLDEVAPTLIQLAQVAAGRGSAQ